MEDLYNKKTRKKRMTKADQISQEIAKLSAACEVTIQKLENFLKKEEPLNEQRTIWQLVYQEPG